MTVDQPDRLDIVARKPDGTVVLAMVEHRPWDGSEERLLELQTKIKNYVGFAREGLVREHPETEGAPVRIQLICVEDPDEVTSRFLEEMRELLAKHDVGLDVQVGPGLGP